MWGYTSSCDDKVSVNFDNKDYPASMITDASKGDGARLQICYVN